MTSMAKDVKQMYQCRLQRENTSTVGWIEKRGAKVGRKVELLPFKEIWEVVAVFDHPLSEDMLKLHQGLNRHSLPSIDAIS